MQVFSLQWVVFGGIVIWMSLGHVAMHLDILPTTWWSMRWLRGQMICDLSGITLPAALEGKKPPCEQSDLSDEERMRKEAVVFDRALQQLCSIWNGKEYDGFPVVAIAPACMSPEEAAVEAEHASISSIFAAGIGTLRENAEMRAMREEFATSMRHCARSYRHCQQLSCKLCGTQCQGIIDCAVA